MSDPDDTSVDQGEERSDPGDCGDTGELLEGNREVDVVGDGDDESMSLDDGEEEELELPGDDVAAETADGEDPGHLGASDGEEQEESLEDAMEEQQEVEVGEGEPQETEDNHESPQEDASMLEAVEGSIDVDDDENTGVEEDGSLGEGGGGENDEAFDEASGALDDIGNEMVEEGVTEERQDALGLEGAQVQSDVDGALEEVALQGSEEAEDVDDLGEVEVPPREEAEEEDLGLEQQDEEAEFEAEDESGPDTQPEEQPGDETVAGEQDDDGVDDQAGVQSEANDGESLQGQGDDEDQLQLDGVENGDMGEPQDAQGGETSQEDEEEEANDDDDNDGKQEDADDEGHPEEGEERGQEQEAGPDEDETGDDAAQSQHSSDEDDHNQHAEEHENATPREVDEQEGSNCSGGNNEEDEEISRDDGSQLQASQSGDDDHSALEDDLHFDVDEFPLEEEQLVGDDGGVDMYDDDLSEEDEGELLHNDGDDDADHNHSGSWEADAAETTEGATTTQPETGVVEDQVHTSVVGSVAPVLHGGGQMHEAHHQGHPRFDTRGKLHRRNSDPTLSHRFRRPDGETQQRPRVVETLHSSTRSPVPAVQAIPTTLHPEISSGAPGAAVPHDRYRKLEGQTREDSPAATTHIDDLHEHVRTLHDVVLSPSMHVSHPAQSARAAPQLRGGRDWAQTGATVARESNPTVETAAHPEAVDGRCFDRECEAQHQHPQHRCEEFRRGMEKFKSATLRPSTLRGISAPTAADVAHTVESFERDTGMLESAPANHGARRIVDIEREFEVAFTSLADPSESEDAHRVAAATVCALAKEHSSVLIEAATERVDEAKQSKHHHQQRRRRQGGGLQLAGDEHLLAFAADTLHRLHSKPFLRVLATRAMIVLGLCWRTNATRVRGRLHADVTFHRMGSEQRAFTAALLNHNFQRQATVGDLILFTTQVDNAEGLPPDVARELRKLMEQCSGGLRPRIASLLLLEDMLAEHSSELLVRFECVFFMLRPYQRRSGGDGEWERGVAVEGVRRAQQNGVSGLGLPFKWHRGGVGPMFNAVL